MSSWNLLYPFVLAFFRGYLAVQHQIVLTHMSSVAEPDYGNISITLIDSKMSFYCYNIHAIERAIITVELNVKTTDYGPFTNFYKKRLDICEFLKNPQLEPLVFLGYKAMTRDKRNHIYNKCPVKPVRNYNISVY